MEDGNKNLKEKSKDKDYATINEVDTCNPSSSDESDASLPPPLPPPLSTSSEALPEGSTRENTYTNIEEMASSSSPAAGYQSSRFGRSSVIENSARRHAEGATPAPFKKQLTNPQVSISISQLTRALPPPAGGCRSPQVVAPSPDQWSGYHSQAKSAPDLRHGMGGYNHESPPDTPPNGKHQSKFTKFFKFHKYESQESMYENTADVASQFEFATMFPMSSYPKLPRSFKYILRNTFVFCQSCVFYNLTLILGLIFVIVFSILTGIYNFMFVWVLAPVLRVAEVSILRCSSVLRSCSLHCVRPVFEACGALYSNVTISHRGLKTLKNVNIV